MKPFIATTFVLVIGFGNRAEAANLAVITSPPTILNLGTLLLALAAVVVGFQLLQAVRGGSLSRPWQIFIGGFAVLSLSQLSMLLQSFEIVSLPVWVTPALMILCAGIFFYGLFETKRVLT